MHSAYPTVAEDFRRALAEADGGYQVTKRELWIAPDIYDLDIFWDRHLSSAEIIAVDIETAVWQITCIGFGTSKHVAITVPFVDFRHPSHSYWDTVEEELVAWEWVQKVLDTPTPKLFQNGTFDSYYLLRMGMPARNWRFDTRLQSHARSPEEPKSLAYLASRFAKVGAWKLMNAEVEEEKKDA